ncbi:hypothetical protein FGO68_gene11800 [Halteria grandinella]|uniref:Uncharacterized protein n=1 Tax=Halteria grandinella TaxID=5974 RepID=A0A8J8NYM3_HALGN|nr:hypothetical protein FGO68_gene11800 [Halteria grandinella]
MIGPLAKVRSKYLLLDILSYSYSRIYAIKLLGCTSVKSRVFLIRNHRLLLAMLHTQKKYRISSTTHLLDVALFKRMDFDLEIEVLDTRALLDFFKLITPILYPLSGLRYSNIISLNIENFEGYRTESIYLINKHRPTTVKLGINEFNNLQFNYAIETLHIRSNILQCERDFFLKYYEGCESKPFKPKNLVLYDLICSSKLLNQILMKCLCPFSKLIIVGDSVIQDDKLRNILVKDIIYGVNYKQPFHQNAMNDFNLDIDSLKPTIFLDDTAQFNELLQEKEFANILIQSNQRFSGANIVLEKLQHLRLGLGYIKLIGYQLMENIFADLISQVSFCCPNLIQLLLSFDQVILSNQILKITEKPFPQLRSLTIMDVSRHCSISIVKEILYSSLCTLQEVQFKNCEQFIPLNLCLEIPNLESFKIYECRQGDQIDFNQKPQCFMLNQFALVNNIGSKFSQFKDLLFSLSQIPLKLTKLQVYQPSYEGSIMNELEVLITLSLTELKVFLTEYDSTQIINQYLFDQNQQERFFEVNFPSASMYLNQLQLTKTISKKTMLAPIMKDAKALFPFKDLINLALHIDSQHYHNELKPRLPLLSPNIENFLEVYRLQMNKLLSQTGYDFIEKARSTLSEVLKVFIKGHSAINNIVEQVIYLPVVNQRYGLIQYLCDLKRLLMIIMEYLYPSVGGEVCFDYISGECFHKLYEQKVHHYQNASNDMELIDYLEDYRQVFMPEIDRELFALEILYAQKSKYAKFSKLLALMTRR